MTRPSLRASVFHLSVVGALVACVGAFAASYPSSDVPMSIIDGGTIYSDLVIADSAIITDVDVQLEIIHCVDSDLDVHLIHPDGTEVELFTDVGGSGAHFGNTVLDDEASKAITSGFAPFGDRYQPEGSLADLDGKNINGTWQLRVCDDTACIGGTLYSWSLTITLADGGLLYVGAWHYPEGSCLDTYDIDTDTLTTIVPDFNCYSCLEVAPDGTLYGTWADGLFEIDEATGDTTPVAPFQYGTTLIVADGFTFTPDGSMYVHECSDRTGTSKHWLFECNGPSDADELALIGEVTGIEQDMRGIEYAAGTLYGAYDALYSINTSTGAATKIGSGTHAWDMDYGPGGVMWATSPSQAQINEIDLSTGAMTLVKDFGDAPKPFGVASEDGIDGNMPPTAPTSCTIAPSKPESDDDLAASATGSTDVNGDTITYTYQWAKSNGGWTWDGWGNDGPALDASNTSKGQMWKARARAYDGTDYSAWTESPWVEIGNDPPPAPRDCSIVPDSPDTTDDLAGHASGTSYDYSDTITYEFQWAKSTDGGTTWGAWGNDGETLDHSNTTRDDHWKARARAYDGTDYSDWTQSQPVTIVNSPPTGPTACTISPAGPAPNDDLTTSATGSTDADGDTITYEYQWAKSTDGGSTWGSWGNDGDTLDHSNTKNGDQWKARARAYDGIDYSGWTESSVVWIGNTPPTDPTDCTISPDSPDTTHDLTASANGSTDVNGDPIAYEYQWAKSTDGGSTWASWGHDGAKLDNSNTARDDQWKARARAYDGEYYSGWAESGPVTIGNAPPTAPTTCTLSPTGPDTNDDLTASVSGSTDPDGDTITYQYLWLSSTEDSNAWSGWFKGDTLDHSETEKDEQWKVWARAYDGIDYSAYSESNHVTIANSPPTDPTSCTISPATPDTNDDLTASASGSEDDDSDTITYEYQWAKSTDSGSTWNSWGNNGATLAASNTSIDDQWKARARAYDGTDYGGWKESSPVSIQSGDTSRPDITGWEIAATHDGGVGELVASIGDGYVEPRRDGILKLIITFDEPLGAVTADNSDGEITVEGVNSGDCSSHVDQLSLHGSDDVLWVEMSPALPNQDTYTITVTSMVTDAAGNPVGGDCDIEISALIGDVNADGVVNIADMLTINDYRGESTTEANALCDVNQDGVVNIGDLLKVNAHRGDALP